jgi:hypothetical protein
MFMRCAVPKRGALLQPAIAARSPIECMGADASIPGVLLRTIMLATNPIGYSLADIARLAEQ